MMAAAAGVPAALRQHYNACTDRAITLDGLATMVADALGKRADIVHYNVKVRCREGPHKRRRESLRSMRPAGAAHIKRAHHSAWR